MERERPQRPNPAGFDGDVERWLRVEALLDEWIEAGDAAQRESLLRSVRSSDPGLLRDLEEMLRWLSVDDALERPLAESASELLREVWRRADGDPEQTRRGQLLGPYRLLDVLDRGGMGVVYVAERADGQFEKRVAVKLLPAGLETFESERRFLTERQILAQLEHPNIARLLDGGVTDEGYPYLVMELVDGRPIDAYCADLGLGLEARIELFLQVCDAVQHAHQHMVVHRDLKPGNILVSVDGTVKLLDFGIAKLEDPGFATSGALTVFQPRSVRYASPEQIANQAVSAASDVYSLGVILYELLAGAPPFELAGLSPAEAEAMVRDLTPQAPSVRATASWRRRLGGDLDNIVLLSLRKDPLRRYGSATDFAEDLRRYLGGRPVRARPNTRRYRVAKFVRRHRFGVAVASIVSVLAVGGVAAIVRQSRIAALERDRAELAADFVLEFMTIPDPDRGGGTTITSRELLDQARVRVSKELAGQQDLQIRILSVIAEGYHNLGVFDVAAEIQRDLIRRLESAGNRRGLGKAHMALGSALGRDGRGEEAIEHLERAVELQRRELGPESREVATALGTLASAIAVGLPPNHPAAARLEPLLLEAIAIHRGLGDRDHPELATELHLLGQVYFARAFAEPGNLDVYVAKAEDTMREALAMRRRIFGDEGFPVAETLNDLGLGIDALGRAEEAMAMLEEALEIHRLVLGDEHPDSLHILNNVAAMHRDAGDYATAESLYRECLEQWRKIHPEDDRQMWAPLYGLGRALLGLGDLDGAEQVLERLFAVLGPDEVIAHAARSVLGEIEMRRGSFDEAERLLLDAHEGLIRLLAPAHPEAVRARARLVTLYESWGRPAMADRYREKLRGSA
jgi:serine/threonine-protein kinase